jgi:hypothetical protein
MKKRALVVGINDYSHQQSFLKDSKVSNLQYCVSDANSMYHLLIHSFGFSAQDVLLYTNARATRRNIMSALTQILSHSEAGDVVCFYYAGHGGMVPATANPDNTRFYESIIPYAGDWIFDSDLDDILYHSQLDISAVNFTIILDSCHAGGIHPTDAIQQSIARSIPLSPNAVAAIQKIQTNWPFGICLPDGEEKLIIGNVSNPRVQNGVLLDLDEDPDKTLIKSAQATLLAACKYYQTAGEDPTYQHGYFTQSFLNVVNQCNFRMSYNDLLNHLRAQVSKLSKNTQTPELRGQQGRADHIFLEGWNTSIPN